MKKSLLCLLALPLFFACNDTGARRTPGSNAGSTLPSLKTDPADWGGNFAINISATRQISKEMTLYTLLSRYGDEPVGFHLLFRDPGGKAGFVSNGVILRPMGGDTSNNFLAVLAQIYGVSGSHFTFADSVVATYVNLNNLDGPKKPGDWTAAQLKLFFGDGSVELFMNINRDAGTISFPEKDSANRASLIEAFSKHGQAAAMQGQTPAK